MVTFLNLINCLAKLYKFNLGEDLAYLLDRYTIYIIVPLFQYDYQAEVRGLDNVTSTWELERDIYISNSTGLQEN